MCGIVYMHSDKAVSKKLYKRYQKQSARGNEGYGFVAFTDKKVKVYERFQTETEVHTALKQNNDTHVLLDMVARQLLYRHFEIRY